MNAYSKLRIFNKKSRSIDFSDLLIAHITSPDETEKTHESNAPETSPSQSSKRTVHEEIHTIKEHDDQDQDRDDGGEEVQARNTNHRSVGAMQFSNRSSSLSSATSSNGFMLARQSSATTPTTVTATISSSSSWTRKRGIQSALKRAFSMRRYSSSSVSHEKYCRIHDQCVGILLDEDDDDDEVDNGDDNTMGSSTENKKCGSKGKIFKACKRLLGFHSTKY